jgi:murein L,D-transpeptidase YcbB/YkuD
LLEKEAKEPGYMSKAGFVWRASSGEEGAPSRLIQRPGPENALGRMKFVFPNHHAVYIHDTPNRGLFSRNDRTLSHGCIRLENPAGLALALLGRQGWDAAKLEAALALPGTRRLQLDSSVPVFLDYRTATVDGDGRLQLWPDIYGFDESGVTRFPSKGLPPDRPPEPVRPAAPPVPPAAAPTVAASVAAPPPPVAGSPPAALSAGL